ncbi:TorF family putative porin [Croceicoccus sp. Ery15]|uniref:TorF family putative porin n=1 Tax=Croceicoccus sp. Ery15 TaxID=1703338 RepID=UPI001E48CA16|nr:TorF family putative porin [Croceicoccus sp. Ery15]
MALTAIIPAAAEAQSGPTIDFEAVTDYRDRGLSWSDGEIAARARIELPVTTSIDGSVQALTLRGSDRHGGADAGFDLAASYSGYEGLIDWRAGAVYHLFAGGNGDLDYVEVEAGAGASLGPAVVNVSASYAPSQDSIGGSNFYGRIGASLGIPATPLVVYGHAGRSSGTNSGSGNVTRLRPAGSYADWAVGAEYYIMPFTVSLTYSDTDIHRDELRVPVLDHHYGEKLVAGASIRF